MSPTPQSEENVADPFAADIFAARQKSDGEAGAERIAPPDSNWMHLLKKALPVKVNWNELLFKLPPDFSAKLSAKLSEALQNLLTLPVTNGIEILPLVTREINRTEDFPHFSDNSWWLSVMIEQSGAEFAIEIDNAFGIWLVDAALGEKVSEEINLRELTGTEMAVLEFLSLNLIYEANRALQSPLFKIRSLSPQLPGWLEDARQNFIKSDSILSVNCQIIHGLLPSILSIYLTPAVLKNLSADENPILYSAQRNAPAWQSFQKHTEDVQTTLPLGQIELTFAELASLETGDVVLLENYNLNLFGGNLFGRAEIFLGDGGNLKISGEILSPDAAFVESFEENDRRADNKILARKFSASQTWKFVITNLTEIRKPPEFGQSMTETDEDITGKTGDEPADGHSSGGGLALENLTLTMRVELGARRLTLAEINNLRENQILELGIRPTDPVNLLLGNQVVGRGELVEIEERLGVRITKLLR